VAWQVHSALAAVPILALLFTLSFFRDPVRRSPPGENTLVAPADGRITDVSEVASEGDLSEPSVRVGIFLSVFDVHVNRTPCAGVVKATRYTKGEFLDARHPECGKRNERNDILIERPAAKDRVLVRQISGAIARRIVCACRENDVLEKGQKVGMIKFGSRTELYVPSRSACRSNRKGRRPRQGRRNDHCSNPHARELGAPARSASAARACGRWRSCRRSSRSATRSADSRLHQRRQGMAAVGESARRAEFQNAAYLILIAMIFDALDGKVARMTRTASNFGTQLDSLCDFFTFGVVPAFLTYGLCHDGAFGYRVVLVVSAFYMCLAATRLARFNVETGTEEKYHRDFTGLPTPAAAGVVATIVIPWSAIDSKWLVTDALNWGLNAGLPIVVFFLAILMVSRVPYSHFLDKLMRGPRPFVTLVEIAVILLLAFIFHQFALFLGFMGYAVIGPILWARSRILRRGPVKARSASAEPPAGDPLF
jgi:phosphatidylserine decarboxylase